MKIQELEDAYGNPVVLIDNEDGSFTSMPKEVYDAQQAVVPPTIN
jgi:hypothetical protein